LKPLFRDLRASQNAYLPLRAAYSREITLNADSLLDQRLAVERRGPRDVRELDNRAERHPVIGDIGDVIGLTGLSSSSEVRTTPARGMAARRAFGCREIRESASKRTALA
jgi:hypothetical protein